MSSDTVDFDTFQWKVSLPEPVDVEWGMSATPLSTRGSTYIELELLSDPGYYLLVGLFAEYTGADDDDGTEPYRMRLTVWPTGFLGGLPARFGPTNVNDLDQFWLKVERDGTDTLVSFSLDAIEWSILDQVPVAVEIVSSPAIVLNATPNARTALYGAEIHLGPNQGPDPEPDDGWDDGWDDWDEDADFSDYPDYWDPYATAPADPQFACSSVLDQILEYSRLTHRPIRIVSGNQISLVDINAEGIPTGFHNFEDKVYVTTKKDVQAGAHTLSLDRANRTVSASASFKEDDTRLLVSRHRPPQLLTTFGGMPPAPVARVNLSFTPLHFNSSVEFAISDEGVE
jgi:hypothetical protein